MTDSVERAVDCCLRPFAPRKCTRRATKYAGWSGPRLKAEVARLFPHARMSLREVVRAWKRNGRTTVRMWFADEETSGARYPTEEFTEWFFYKTAERCAQRGETLPEAA